MQLSIIIVNYNTKSLLQDCITSIYTHTKDISFEIIVSDNGSTDGSLEMLKSTFPEVRIIENNKNLGFGTANNKALALAKGKYIFYLNSDTVLLNNACKFFIDYWETSCDKQNIGALGSNLLDIENCVIHSFGDFPGFLLSLKQLFVMFFTNLILSFFYIFHISAERFRSSPKRDYFIGDVDYITGADLFVLNDENAYFDEDFFLYFEETDLQKRLQNQNKKRLIIEGPKIQHLCGGSVTEKFSIKRKASYSRIMFEISRIKYLKKHCANKNTKKVPLFLCKLMVTIIWLNPLLFKNTKKFIKQLWEI